MKLLVEHWFEALALVCVIFGLVVVVGDWLSDMLD